MDDPLFRYSVGTAMGSSSSQACKLQQHLHDQMLSQSEFCDVTLVIGEGEMKAHWCVLVYCSYFQSLYDSGMRERQSGRIKVNCGKPYAVRLALSFLYTGVAEMSYENIKDLLEVAEYFQITDLKLECAEYLRSVSISSDNCVSLCLLSDMYDLDIYHHAYSYLRGHIPEVLEQSETLTLTNDSILELLRDKMLCYVPQETFYSFLMRWVEKDAPNREQYFPELFCALDLEKIPKKFLNEKIETQPLVKKFENCNMHLLNTQMKYLNGHLKDNDDKRDVILIAGGCGIGPSINDFVLLFPFSDAMSVNNIYGYIIQEERWTELAPLPYRMRKPIITYDGGDKIYVYDASQYKQCEVFYVYVFKISEKYWSNFRMEAPDQCVDMSIESVVACRQELYLVASLHIGRGEACDKWQTVLLHVNQEGGKCSVKCHLFLRNVNTQMTVCTVSRMFICVLGWKIGHAVKNKHARYYPKFVYFNVKTGRRIDSSRGSVFDPLVFSVDDELIVAKFGKASARKFNFRDRCWKSAKEFALPNPPEFPSRVDYSYTTSGTGLYLIGGKDFETKKPVDSTLKFNFTSREWTKLDSLLEGRMYSGTCVTRMPQAHVRCHIKCPHCVYCFRKNQVKYDIDYQEEEDDDDYEDYDYGDYDGISDYWDVDDDDDVDVFDPFDEVWY
ncbi:hypothetical protein ScPMuIL_014841 [Solemya velum]